MINASDLKRMVALRAEEFCRDLFPAGKKVGAEFQVGSLNGDAGDSLSVHLAGERAGVWKDFAGTEKGDFIQLWMEAKQCGFRDAFRAIKDWLRISEPVAVNEPKKYAKPNKSLIKTKGTAFEAVMSYLSKERKISYAALETFKVRAAEDHDGKGGADMVFPQITPSGELSNVKYIGIERTKNEKGEMVKHLWQSPDCAQILFGWQVVDKDARCLLITEGEIDAMTWWDWGFKDAVSIPSGCTNLGWITLDWENLEPFETIYLCFDMDKAGQDAVKKVAHRLGLHRCKIVSLPFNDPNECLKNGVDGGQAARFIMEARPIIPSEIKRAADYRAEVMASLSGEKMDAEEIGLKTKIFGSRMLFRPGELTLWTGHTSHGKSTFLIQMMIYALLAGQRVAVGSFEIKGRITVEKFICNLLFQGKPISSQEVHDAIDWFGDKLWIYDVIGIMKRPKLSELMLYSVMRHGVQHIVIDSLMKCDLNSEDYEAQRIFINDLHGFAMEHDVHVHLVGHPRKGKDDEEEPGIMDVHGGQSVIAQPDNIICVWRNREKEKSRNNNELPEHKENTWADSIAFVKKQRHSGDEFAVKLWFSRKQNRYTTHYGEGPAKFEDFGIIQTTKE